MGAMLGPLAAFGLLYLAPGGYDAVFVVSFSFALVGLSILLLFVENQRPETAPGEEPHEPEVSLRSVASLLNVPRFRILVIVGAALSLATMSEAFVYLGIQRRVEFDPEFFPLLYVGTALVFMIGGADGTARGPDRKGAGVRRRLRAAAAPVRAADPPSTGSAEVFVYLLLFGAYYAATEVRDGGRERSVADVLRGSGLALLVTATSLAPSSLRSRSVRSGPGTGWRRRLSPLRSAWPSRLRWQLLCCRGRPQNPLMRRRTQALAVIAVCVLVGTVYVAFAIARGSETDDVVSGDDAASQALDEGGMTILFQHIARDDDYAHVAVAHRSGPSRVASPPSANACTSRPGAGSVCCRGVAFSGTSSRPRSSTATSTSADA